MVGMVTLSTTAFGGWLCYPRWGGRVAEPTCRPVVRRCYPARNLGLQSIRLYALEWGERILILGGTSEIAGCAARESKHLTHCLPECASLIRRTGTPSI
jgi:hypothetical protein